MCRHPRSRQNNNDPENQLDMQSMSRNNNNNEPSNITLEKLNMMCPIQTAGDSLLDIKYSTCAICLDDFKPTSHIRILPCLHSYCVDCIDLWLTKKSRFCPVCKRDMDKEASNKEDNDDDGDIGNSTMNPSNEMNNSNNISVHLTSFLPSTSTTTAPSSGIQLNSRTSPSLQPEASFIDLNNPPLTAITPVSNNNNNHDREEIDLTTIAMPVPMSSSPRVPLPSQMESNIESINEQPTPPHDKQQQQQQQ
ncbi:hypothetical protein BJ944DRAFT_258720 [Cunninghamella echinulata]|nr:hypothetical protein BJ944DRAFT_258720 [Cunninghamella echinulata]